MEQFTLSVGTEVSAKYRGAWCEGTVTRVDRRLSCRINFSDKEGGSKTVTHDAIRGAIKLNSDVKAEDPDTGKLREGTIAKVSDNSLYTVEFPDGDERTLRRTAVTLKGAAASPMLSEDTIYSPEDKDKRRRSDGGSPSLDGGSPASFTSPPTAHPAAAGASAQGNGTGAPQQGSGNRLRDGSARLREALRNNPDSHVSRIRDAGAPSGRHHEVVLVNPCQGGEEPFWWPAMVVPEKEVVRSMIGAEKYDKATHMVVRFFEDNCFAIIEPMYMKLLERGTRPFVTFLRNTAFQEHPAVQRALQYLDSGELPPNFRWSSWSDENDSPHIRQHQQYNTQQWGSHSQGGGSQGHNEEDEEQEEEEDEDDWHPDPREEEKFRQEFEAFNEQRGTPMKRTPSLGFKDLDLFRLYTLVTDAGGFAKVTADDRWKELYADMGFGELKQQHSTTGSNLSGAYTKHLLAFEQHKAAAAEVKAAKVKDESPSKRTGGRRGQATSQDDSVESNGGAEEGGEDGEEDDVFEFAIGDMVDAPHSDGNTYKAKVVERRLKKDKTPQYLIHYPGWAKRYDVWKSSGEIRSRQRSSRASKDRSKRDSAAAATAASSAPPATTTTTTTTTTTAPPTTTTQRKKERSSEARREAEQDRDADGDSHVHHDATATIKDEAPAPVTNDLSTTDRMDVREDPGDATPAPPTTAPHMEEATKKAPKRRYDAGDDGAAAGEEDGVNGSAAPPTTTTTTTAATRDREPKSKKSKKGSGSSSNRAQEVESEVAAPMETSTLPVPPQTPPPMPWKCYSHFCSSGTRFFKCLSPTCRKIHPWKRKKPSKGITPASEGWTSLSIETRMELLRERYSQHLQAVKQKQRKRHDFQP